MLNTISRGKGTIMNGKHVRGIAFGFAAVAVTLTLSACSGSSPTPVGSSPVPSSPTSGTPSATDMPTAAAATLTISGFMFSPLTVKAGETVTVVNKDAAAHTVKVGGTDVDVQVHGGGTISFVAPAKPGTYPLTCDFHASMQGTLTVTA